METYWYVLRVILGRERLIEERFNKKINNGELPMLKRFLCPVEKEYYTSKGKSLIRDRVIYGGYLYVETYSHLNKEYIDNIISDVDIKGFLGDNNNPKPMSRLDVSRIIKDEELEKRIESKRQSIDVGTTVKVIDGPFFDFNGVVNEILKDKVKVLVKIFGRETIVDLQINQIKKNA